MKQPGPHLNAGKAHSGCREAPSKAHAVECPVFQVKRQKGSEGEGAPVSGDKNPPGMGAAGSVHVKRWPPPSQPKKGLTGGRGRSLEYACGSVPVFHVKQPAHQPRADRRADRTDGREPGPGSTSKVCFLFHVKRPPFQKDVARRHMHQRPELMGGHPDVPRGTGGLRAVLVTGWGQLKNGADARSWRNGWNLRSTWNEPLREVRGAS